MFFIHKLHMFVSVMMMGLVVMMMVRRRMELGPARLSSRHPAALSLIIILSSGVFLQQAFSFRALYGGKYSPHPRQPMPQEEEIRYVNRVGCVCVCVCVKILQNKTNVEGLSHESFKCFFSLSVF
jgi:hypothetical protein